MKLQGQKISFTRKIPIAQCNIIDKKTNQNTIATVFEYDCKDKKDIDELEKIAESGRFEYGHCVYFNAEEKYSSQIYYSDEFGIYTVENPNGEVIGICSTRENEDGTNINFIETEHGKYRYIGRSIIETLGKRTIENNRKWLFLRNVQENAKDLYKRWGFHPHENTENGRLDMSMPIDEVERFIAGSQNNTKECAIDFNA